MQDVQELLRQKELEFQKLSKEIEALRLTLRMLEEADAEEPSKTRQPAASGNKITTPPVSNSADRSSRLPQLQSFENGHGSGSEGGLQFP